MRNWDDIRFFLAVARTGSMTGGADALGVDQSTVSRRIAYLERKLDVKLFERHPTGYVLTLVGEALFHHAQRMDDELIQMERDAVGQDRRLSGTIRVSASEPVKKPGYGEPSEVTEDWHCPTIEEWLLPSTPLTLQPIEIIECKKTHIAKNDENRVKKRQNHIKTT
jgi:hypothetical protein